LLLVWHACPLGIPKRVDRIQIPDYREELLTIQFIFLPFVTRNYWQKVQVASISVSVSAAAAVGHGLASKVNELLSFTPWLQPGDQREK
jgi:hypothetical protein